MAAWTTIEPADMKREQEKWHANPDRWEPRPDLCPYCEARRKERQAEQEWWDREQAAFEKAMGLS